MLLLLLRPQLPPPLLLLLLLPFLHPPLPQPVVMVCLTLQALVRLLRKPVIVSRLLLQWLLTAQDHAVRKAKLSVRVVIKPTIPSTLALARVGYPKASATLVVRIPAS